MRKATLVGIIGFVLLLLPFLGIPVFIKEYGYTTFGVLLVLLSYLSIRAEVLRRSDLGNGERGNDSFVETTEPLFKEDTLQ